MHTQNIKTAAPESSERWVYTPTIWQERFNENLAFLSVLHTQRMCLEERAELLLGTLVNIADSVVDSVTDWDSVRLPANAVTGWFGAGKKAVAMFGPLGESAWEYAREHLATDLIGGHAMHVNDIY